MELLGLINNNTPIMLVIVLLLLVIVLKLSAPALKQIITTPLKELTDALKCTNGSLSDLKTEFKEYRQEVTEERKADRHTIGTILDRMQKQESTCETHRSMCQGNPTCQNK